MRINQKDLRTLANVINNLLCQRGTTDRIVIRYDYGQPRAYLAYDSDRYNDRLERPLSPILRSGLLHQWLRAFHEGLLYAGEVAEQAAEPPPGVSYTYDCPICGRDLTAPIDKINAGGWGNGAEGDLVCKGCGTEINVQISVETDLVLRAKSK